MTSAPPAIRTGPAPPVGSPATELPAAHWHPLPPQARTQFILAALVRAAILAIPALAVAGLLLPTAALKATAVITLLALLPALLVWLAIKKFRHTFWTLDDEGFAVRRGRFWQVEIRVPGSRVQHLEIVRGPLQRRFGLSTLVVHTAGTRQNAVSLAGLDTAEAEWLRDRLARHTNDDDDRV